MYDLLINKKHPLSKDYVPDNLIITDNNENNFHEFADPNHKPSIIKDVYEAFKVLQKEALKDGINIIIDSGYRSYEYQQVIWDTYVENKGLEYTVTHVAPPGTSEHQSGLAIDFGAYRDGIFTSDITEDSKEYIWMINNAYKYGFILRYPKGKENITGYSFEPWHFRFIDLDIANYIHDNDITLEEYYKDL